MRALTTAASGMMAQQLNVEVISNNIANMNTIGYKRQRAEFQDLLYQTMERAGAPSSASGTIVPNGIQIGVGVKTGSVSRITTQGNLTNTGNRFDLAIDGLGYFQVSLPSGETAYTRAGNFSINDQGQLVTEDGYQILPAVTIPDAVKDVTINKEGQIFALQDGQDAPTQVGALELASFINPAGLDAIGDNLFLISGASGAASTGTPGSAGYGTLMQGFVETANVDAVAEISSLIMAQRGYEMNSKVITTADQMLGITSDLKR